MNLLTKLSQAAPAIARTVGSGLVIFLNITGALESKGDMKKRLKKLKKLKDEGWRPWKNKTRREKVFSAIKEGTGFVFDGVVMILSLYGLGKSIK